VITPRTTRLLRVPGLQAMHRALAECVAADVSRPLALIVPTSGARDALGRTFELSLTPGDFDVVTRDELYARLHERLPSAPPLLTAFEREVLLSRAAAAVVSEGIPAPFRLRPGLIVEILAFYDELRRRHRSVADFDRLMTDSLQASAEIDRGAEQLFKQTEFLAAAFRRFESLVESSGRLDEHALRRWLLAHDGLPLYRRVVVSVADQAADPRGLWTADYDMLARLPGLEALDVVATENVLAAGFHERVHDVLPGIEELRRGAAGVLPVLVTPAASGGDAPPRWFVSRDREEELAEFVRGVAPDCAGRTAVVFQRPLPYLYLARSVFADAAQPYQALDSLPLAAEPFAAALDVIFAFVIAEANRASTVDLLGSPHWQFPQLSGPLVSVRARVSALDSRLRELKYFGGWDRLNGLVSHAAFAARETPIDKSGDEGTGRRRRRPRADAGDALQAAIAAAEALRPVREAATASDQLRALLDFIRSHERPPDGDAAWAARHLRARAAVVGAVESLADAQARHDDAPLPVDRLAGAVRRWIEGQTFSPRTGSRGVLLLDAPAAAYADVDELRLVGLVEHDWPERVRRSIFYPASLLTQLGWPNETDRLAAARARFHDLLRLPHLRVSVSTFTLEDDAIVSGSSFLQELDASGLPIEREASAAPARAAVPFAHEALIEQVPRSARLGETPRPALAGSSEAAAWLALRVDRSPGESQAYHGAAGARAPDVYAVSHVERYLDCPFKYFAARVLRLDEEKEDESGLSPQERGQLLHEVFEAFFARWHARGGRAITADSLEDALALFTSVAEATLARLPEADRALERTYLLGSAVAAGLGERAFNFEIEQDVPVLERLLEHPLEGEFEFAGAGGPRRVKIRAKADRIDLLEDGTLRVIDYKLGRAPKAARALQLPVYGLCAEQHLEGRHGRSWTVASAGYVAFKEKNPFVALGSSTSLQQALDDGAARFVAAVDGIERGEFPVRPEEPFWCTRCGYSGVCRKDYVGDE
jgi:RecB family exonuclease